MTANSAYQQLVLNWQPASKLDHSFNMIVLVVMALMLTLGFVLSSIELPQEERRAVTPIPERVAQFITEKPKPKPLPKPKPKPLPKPKVKRQLEKQKEEKPLTESQQQARKKAEETGLLALGNELADLIETSEVSAMVGGKVSTTKTTNQTVGYSRELLTGDAAKGSGGINSEQYAAAISSTQLSERERGEVRQALLTENIESSDKSKGKTTRTGDNLRGEEEITVVFDQNKGKLYSIYNRARRSNPGLKGKVVLELTIAPSGQVTKVRIVSSELNDPKLEKSLLVRVKQFKFTPGEVEAVTVTFPIEFLPS